MRINYNITLLGTTFSLQDVPATGIITIIILILGGRGLYPTYWRYFCSITFIHPKKFDEAHIFYRKVITKNKSIIAD